MNTTVVPVKHKTADQITVLEAEYLSVADTLGMLARATAGIGPDQVAKLADKADWEAAKAVSPGCTRSRPRQWDRRRSD